MLACSVWIEAGLDAVVLLEHSHLSVRQEKTDPGGRNPDRSGGAAWLAAWGMAVRTWKHTAGEKV